MLILNPRLCNYCGGCAFEAGAEIKAGAGEKGDNPGHENGHLDESDRLNHTCQNKDEKMSEQKKPDGQATSQDADKLAEYYLPIA